MLVNEIAVARRRTVYLGVCVMMHLWMRHVTHVDG